MSDQANNLLHQMRRSALRKHQRPAWGFITCHIVINYKMWHSISKHARINRNKGRTNSFAQNQFADSTAKPKSIWILCENTGFHSEKCPWRHDLLVFKEKSSNRRNVWRWELVMSLHEAVSHPLLKLPRSVWKSLTLVCNDSLMERSFFFVFL